MSGTPNKYKPENQNWTQIDQKHKCDERVVICPICVQNEKILDKGIIPYGHPRIYLDSQRQTYSHIGIDFVVVHGHFTDDIEKGRNCWCVYEKGMIDKKDLIVTYKLPTNNKLPKWIRDKLSGDLGSWDL